MALPDNEQSAAAKRNCGIFVIRNSRWPKFFDKYHLKQWFGADEAEVPSSCIVLKASQETDLRIKCVELGSPPPLIPKGNVGTPSSLLKLAIRDCRMPSKLIGKLQLDFREAKCRKYSSVPPPATVCQRDVEAGPSKSRFNAVLRPEAPCAARRVTSTKPPTIRLEEPKGSARCDDDLGEEWERHNSLNNDVSARRMIDEEDHFECQPGTKERLFEEEMEVTWEKGGSGLVFYTDAQYWHMQKEDDERNVDDWDVDTSIYYDETGGGDMDAKQARDMRLSDDLRDGKVAVSLFRKPKRHAPFAGTAFTKKIMKRQGWRSGQGLGASSSGIKNPIEERGQVGKSGLGYKEPKAKVWGRVGKSQTIQKKRGS